MGKKKEEKKLTTEKGKGWIKRAIIKDDVKKDGHCYYHVLRHELRNVKGIYKTINGLRKEIGQNVRKVLNPGKDNGLEFLMKEIEWRVKIGIDKETIGEEGWAGEPEIIITKEIYNLDINIYEEEEDLILYIRKKK